MQSSANVQLSPEEEMTVSVSANDLGDLGKGALCVVGMPWLPVGDGNEGIPSVPIKKLKPALFKRMIQGVPLPTRIRERRAYTGNQVESSQLLP